MNSASDTLESPEKALEEAIGIAGGPSALAEKIAEKNPQVITNWRKRGVPPKKCGAIEAATGISRERLRPDVFGPLPQDTQEAA